MATEPRSLAEPGRPRSFWGWGHADRFPDRTQREALASMVSGLLGVALELREPPRADDIALAAPRLALPDRLAGLGSAAPLDRLAHTYGKSYRDLARGFAGDFAAAPEVSSGRRGP